MSRVNPVKPGSNMYQGWITHTWSPGRGCPHQCGYCYVKDFGGQPAEFTLDPPFPPLGKGRTIFVGHMCDLFAQGVPDEAVRAVLIHVGHYPGNTYVFQTKASLRALAYADSIPRTAIIGTTIETNWDSVIANIMGDDTTAPVVEDRALGLWQFHVLGYKTFLTIEPMMNFNSDEMVRLITIAQPDFVNIGADSKGHGLHEPEPEKVKDLIQRLRTIDHDVRIKPNLKRLLPEGWNP